MSESIGKISVGMEVPMTTDNSIPTTPEKSSKKYKVADISRLYQRLGWGCIALKTDTDQCKRPTGDWKHLIGLDRTVTEEYITSNWVTKNNNIGIICGITSRLVVVDTDSAEAEEWAKMNLPVTLTATTRKGYHRFYRFPQSVIDQMISAGVCGDYQQTENWLKNNGYGTKIKMTAGDAKIDIDRKLSGYVVAVPSICRETEKETGEVVTTVREWMKGAAPFLKGEAELPEYDPEWFTTAEPLPVKSVSPDPKYTLVEDDGIILSDGFIPDRVVSDDDDKIRWSDLTPKERKEKKRQAKEKINKITSIEGKGGDKDCYRVACILTCEYDMPLATALDVMTAWSETNAKPAWSVDEMTRKLECAGKQPITAKYLQKLAVASKGKERDAEIAALVPTLIEDGWMADDSHICYRYDSGAGCYIEQDDYASDGLYAQVYAIHARHGELKGDSHVSGIVKTIKKSLTTLTWNKSKQIQRDNYISLSNGLLDKREVLNGNQKCVIPHTADIFTTYRIVASWTPGLRLDPAMSEAIERMMGGGGKAVKAEEYARFGRHVILGDTRHQKALYLWGEPGRGKSQLAQIMQKMIPESSCTSLTPPQMLEKFKILTLRNSLLNIGSECSYLSHAEQQILKSITGGDEITGEIKGGAIISFKPRCNLVFTSNNQLSASTDESGAFRARLRPIKVEGPCMRDRSGQIQDYSEHFWTLYGDQFVTWCLSQTGNFGDATGIYEDGWELSPIQEFVESLPDVITTMEAMDMWRRSGNKDSMSPKRMAQSLITYGFKSGDRKRVLVGGAHQKLVQFLRLRPTDHTIDGYDGDRDDIVFEGMISEIC